jgi:hypothetical protein
MRIVPLSLNVALAVPVTPSTRKNLKITEGCILQSAKIRSHVLAYTANPFANEVFAKLAVSDFFSDRRKEPVGRRGTKRLPRLPVPPAHYG